MFTQVYIKMKNTLILVLFPLFVIGVFAGELKSVSVKEGDSVTLNTGVQIKGSDVIDWRLNGKLIFRISSSAGNISVSDFTDGAFRDRLKVDKLTGDLKITNFRTTDSGEYSLKIRSSRGSSDTTFSVTGVSDRDPVKSVTVGESITLKTQIQSDEVKWRFGAENSLIAEINKRTDRITQYHDVLDGRFRGRLKLDNHTGSLTITNITDTHSGVYEADIINVNSFTILRTFTVAVSGVKSVSVMEGESVSLSTGVTEIQRDDVILWFGDQALITPSTGSVGPRWKNTDQDHQTGDLTIRNIQRDQSGDYRVKIIKSSVTTVPRKFHINISGVFSSETDGVKTVTVNNGESVLLNTLVTEIQQADLMEWLFGPQNIIIAKTDGKSNSPSYTNNDVRFENRLNLDIQTGSLTIENSNRGDSGLYQLKIINSTFTIQKRFRVSVSDSGPSPGAIAGIVIVSLIVLFAAVVGVKFYRWKKSKAKQRKMKENPSQLQMLAGEPQ